MPKIGKDDITDVETFPGYEGRFGQLDGYTVGFETYTEDTDPSDLFKGLPDDRCQCPHWGVVLRGKLVFRTDGGDVEIGAGEAYYVGPGHLPVLSAGTEVIEFSPTVELDKTMEVVAKNAAG